VVRADPVDLAAPADRMVLADQLRPSRQQVLVAQRRPQARETDRSLRCKEISPQRARTGRNAWVSRKDFCPSRCGEDIMRRWIAHYRNLSSIDVRRPQISRLGASKTAGLPVVPGDRAALLASVASSATLDVSSPGGVPSRNERAPMVPKALPMNLAGSLSKLLAALFHRAPASCGVVGRSSSSGRRNHDPPQRLDGVDRGLTQCSRSDWPPTRVAQRLRIGRERHKPLACAG
jgi:hypothetical protein